MRGTKNRENTLRKWTVRAALIRAFVATTTNCQMNANSL